MNPELRPVPDNSKKQIPEPKRTPRFHRATITEDPLKGLPAGTSLRINPIRFGSSDAKSTPKRVTNWDSFEGALIAIGVTDGVHSQMIGNAICISPGLAVTATHVLEASLDEMTNSSVSAFCIGIRADGADHWVISNITYLPRDDVAFLSIQLRSEMTLNWGFTTVGIRMREPEIGEELTVIGFRFPTPVARTKDGGHESPFGGELIAARGKVSDFHSEMRDPILMPYPCIQIECGAPSGVSGGAVMDAHGLLVGVLSRSFETDANDGPAMASWIPPKLDKELTIPWPPGMYSQPVNLLKIPAGLLHLDRE